jgi:hypothetical protein
LKLKLFFLRSKQDAGDANEGLLNVPGRGDVLEGNFEVTAFAGSKRRRLSREYRARFAQNDLAELVREFDGELDVGEREIPRICEAAGKRGDFLI